MAARQLRAQERWHVANVLVHDERESEARSLLEDAREVFSRLGSAPDLQRAEAVLGVDASLQLDRDR